MESVKIYVLSLILICFFLQIGSVFLAGEKYKRIYNLLSSALIISLFLKFPIENFKSEFNYEKLNVTNYNFDIDIIKNDFQEKVSTKLENEIYLKFGVQSKVEVESDFKHITYDVCIYSDEQITDEISKFIRQNFCTVNDEVYIYNELN